jgi:hypothetical protein
VSIITIAGTATASAKGKHKEPISITTALAVFSIEGDETNYHSSWTTIEKETLVPAGQNSAPEWPLLDGLFLSAVQSSHEQFDAPIPFGSVTKGKSKGQFYMSPAVGFTALGPVLGAPVVIGEYQLKLSSSELCQIKGEGKWKFKAKNSGIDGKGDISVCTNFVPAAGTFIAVVTVTGSAAQVD